MSVERRADGDKMSTPAERDLVLSCQAFLDGLYVEYLAMNDQPIPAWAWLNVVAHCDHLRLEVLASNPTTAVEAAARANVREWQETLTFMARRVLEAAPDDGALKALQRTVLVPFELELMNRSSGHMMDARELAGSVLSILHRDARPWPNCVDP